MPLTRDAALAQLGFVAAGFEEELHPRDKDGKWLSKGDVVHVARSPAQGAFRITHIHDDGAVNIKNLTTDRIDKRVGTEFLRKGEPGDLPIEVAPSKPMDLSKPNVKLDAADRQAVYDYAWDFGTYQEVNRALRAGQPIPDDTRWQGQQPEFYRGVADRLTRLTNEGRITQPVTVYRGLADAPEVAHQLKPGTVFNDPGFMSTSLAEDSAREMLDAAFSVPGFKPGQQNNGSVLFKVTIPAGGRALVVGDALTHSPVEEHQTSYDQKEVILPPGSRFRIDRVSVDDEGIQLVDATVV